MAGYFERGIAEGEARDAAAVLIVLDTPGGGLNTTQEIIRLIRNAEVPVIVYIGPAGAQAASAGSLITLAAHASAMPHKRSSAPPRPVSGDGDIARAYRVGGRHKGAGTQPRRRAGRSRGPGRGDGREGAPSMPKRRRRRLVDAISPDEDVLVERTRSRSGRAFREPGPSRLEPLPMGWLEQALHALSDPLVISILFRSPCRPSDRAEPSGRLRGFVGVMALGWRLWSGQLPVNWLGLGFIAVAFVSSRWR